MKHALTIARYELLQRRRSVAWLVLMVVCVVMLIAVAALVLVGSDGLRDAGEVLYPTVAIMALLLVLVIGPTLSGNAVNGDRENATLAAIQVTDATTGQILAGKWLAAVATGAGFVAVCLPFLIVSAVAAKIPPLMVVVNTAILVCEIMVVAAIGVGVSGLIARSLFSVATTYLIVAALTIASPLFFMLATMIDRVTVHEHIREAVYTEDGNPVLDADGKVQCTPWRLLKPREPRSDRSWPLLAPNPFIVLIDSSPYLTNREGYPEGFFSSMRYEMRRLQFAPATEVRIDNCKYVKPNGEYRSEPVPRTAATLPSFRDTNGKLPTWWVGLFVQAALAGALMFGAYRRTAVPAKKMPPGTRIA